MDILGKVLTELNDYEPNCYSANDVHRVLAKDQLDIFDLAILLSPAADGLLEDMAARAKQETARHFGNSISLFTPLYLANFCENHCTYCGFNSQRDIRRGKLTANEIELELKSIADSGLDEILLLCGEDRKHSDINYLGDAVKLAADIFNAVGIEIYPFDESEYRYLHECGADFVNVYQETYLTDVYNIVHPAGPKRSYEYRFNSQERALKAGMRGVSFGALLGLADFRKDSFATGLHAYYLQRRYPHAEISFSVPRLRPSDVSERQLLQAMLAYRIFMPFAGITISTRERAGFRDHVLGL